MVNKIDTTSMICDVVVVGAGLVGLTAVIALAEQGKRVVLVDGKPNETDQTAGWDTRIYALTPGTEAWLRHLGVWPFVDCARVNQVDEMSLWGPEAESPLTLAAEDASLTKLACIIENKNLLQALWQKIEKLNVEVMIGSSSSGLDYVDEAVELRLENGKKISAELLVAADGANSFVRRQLSITTKTKQFNQIALVANYSVELKHGNVARQWFAPHATLALLPLPGKHVSMVWASPNESAQQLLKLSKQELAEQVNELSDGVLGALKPVSETLSFNLKQVTASNLIDRRVVLTGDAAHQVHPMAGQGANLGFRDIIVLEKLIANSHALQDVGEESFLRQYERERKMDIIAMNTLTTGLDGLFSKESALLKRVATWGMNQVNAHSTLKKILIKQAVA